MNAVGTCTTRSSSDQFLKILDKLEDSEAAERKTARTEGLASSPLLAPSQLEVISATTAEEREFNELRRELPRASSLAGAAEVLYRHLRRVVPVTTFALYLPKSETNEVGVVVSLGVGASTLEGLKVPIGERISGWVFAHNQIVFNSDAALELGPVAKTLNIPLRYATAVPIIDGNIVAVMMVLSSEPFEKDHRRLLENAATLFVSSISSPIAAEASQPTSTPASDSSKARIH